MSLSDLKTWNDNRLKDRNKEESNMNLKKRVDELVSHKEMRIKQLKSDLDLAEKEFFEVQNFQNFLETINKVELETFADLIEYLERDEMIRNVPWGTSGVR